MQTYPLSQLTEETLNTLVTLHEVDGAPETWEKMQGTLTPEEHILLDYLRTTLHRHNLMVMNEITLWSRAIYPLLRLAEQGTIQAWAGVPLKATYPTFKLEGEADGHSHPLLGERCAPPISLCMKPREG